MTHSFTADERRVVYGYVKTASPAAAKAFEQMTGRQAPNGLPLGVLRATCAALELENRPARSDSVARLFATRIHGRRPSAS